MSIGIRRIRMTGRSKETNLRIDRGSKRVILEMVFHSTLAKTAIVTYLSYGTNQDSVNIRELDFGGMFRKAIA
jgi:hypothetical protein